MRTNHTSKGRGGFTLVELGIAMAILIVLAGSLVQTASALRGITSTGSVQENLQANAAKAINRITRDLKRSGFTTVAGLDYPHFFTDGVPGAGFEDHAHAPATKTATADEFDFGDDTELVFLAPADADADGVPDVGVDGALVWDASEFSYVVNTDAQGGNVLERRTDAAVPQVIARHVERIVFDDASTAGPVVPFEAVRVRLFLRQTDDQGKVFKYSVQAIIKLRNGG